MAGSGCIRCQRRLTTLPDGTMVQAGDESFLIAQGRALPWSPAGYGEPRTVPDDALLLTPPSTLRALQAGYQVVLHPSAQAHSAR